MPFLPPLPPIAAAVPPGGIPPTAPPTPPPNYLEPTSDVNRHLIELGRQGLPTHTHLPSLTGGFGPAPPGAPVPDTMPEPQGAPPNPLAEGVGAAYKTLVGPPGAGRPGYVVGAHKWLGDALGNAARLQQGQVNTGNLLAQQAPKEPEYQTGSLAPAWRPELSARELNAEKLQTGVTLATLPLAAAGRGTAAAVSREAPALAGPEVAAASRAAVPEVATAARAVAPAAAPAEAISGQAGPWLARAQAANQPVPVRGLFGSLGLNRVAEPVAREALTKTLGQQGADWAARRVVSPLTRYATGEGAVSNAAQALEGMGRRALRPFGVAQQEQGITGPLIRGSLYGGLPAGAAAMSLQPGQEPDADAQRAIAAGQSYLPKATNPALVPFELPARAATIGPVMSATQNRPEAEGETWLGNWARMSGRRLDDLGAIPNQLANQATTAGQGFKQDLADATQGGQPQRELSGHYRTYDTSRNEVAAAESALATATTPQAKAFQQSRLEKAKAQMEQAHDAIAFSDRPSPDDRGAGVDAYRTAMTSAAQLRQLAESRPADDQRRQTLLAQAVKAEQIGGEGVTTSADRATVHQALAQHVPELTPALRELALNEAQISSDQMAQAVHKHQPELAAALAAPAATVAGLAQSGTTPASLAQAVNQPQSPLSGRGISTIVKDLATNGSPPSPAVAETLWGRLGTGSKVMLGLGVGLTILPLLLSLFGDHDNEEDGPGGMGFLGRVLPFLGAGAMIWGAGGGDFNNLPNVRQMGTRDFWTGLSKDVGLDKLIS